MDQDQWRVAAGGARTRFARERFAEQGLALALLARELAAARATLSSDAGDALAAAAARVEVRTPLGDATAIERRRSDGTCVAMLAWGARGYFAPGQVTTVADAVFIDSVSPSGTLFAANHPGERHGMLRALRRASAAAAARAEETAALVTQRKADLARVTQRTDALLERVRSAAASESGVLCRLDECEAAQRAAKGTLVELEDTARIHSVNELQVTALRASLAQLEQQVAALEAEGRAQEEGALKESAAGVAASEAELAALRLELASLEAEHGARASRAASRAAVLEREAEAQEQALLKSGYALSEQRKAAARTLKVLQASRLAAREQRRRLGERRAALATQLAAQAARDFDEREAIARHASSGPVSREELARLRAGAAEAQAALDAASAARARAKSELRDQRDEVVRAHAALLKLKERLPTLRRQRMGAEDSYSRAVELSSLNAELARLAEEEAAQRRAHRAKHGPPWLPLAPVKAGAVMPCTVDSPVIAQVLATWTRDAARRKCVSGRAPPPSLLLLPARAPSPPRARAHSCPPLLLPPYAGTCATGSTKSSTARPRAARGRRICS